MSTITQQATVSEVLDRMHAINQTISVSGLTVIPKRYYVGNLESLPSGVVITPSMPVATQFTQVSNLQYEVLRTYQIRVWAKAWMEGEPRESALRDGEAFIIGLETAYLTRPRLELNDRGIVVGSTLIRAQAFGNDRQQATHVYSLNVRTNEQVQA